MTMYWKVIKSCLPLTRESFEGRATREEYWMFRLVDFFIGGGILLLARMVGEEDNPAIYNGFLLWLAGIYYAVTWIPRMAVAIRRMHDTNSSGWWAWIPLFSLLLATIDSDEGPNKYGENPKHAMETV